MLLLEAFFKFGAIGLFIGMSLLLLRDARHIRALRFAVPLIASLSFMFISTGSPELSLSGPILIPIRLFDSLTPLLIWLFGLSLFDDEFELGKAEWIVVIAYVLIMFPIRLHYLEIQDPSLSFFSGMGWVGQYGLFGSMFSITLMAHLSIKAIQGRDGDLVEKRRSVRVWFVVAIALILILSISTERIVAWLQGPDELTIWITYCLTLPVVIWSILWLTRLHPEMLAFADKASSAKATARSQDALSLKDRVAFEKLTQLMQDDKLYVNHGLSIGELAEQVGVAEHHLRKLINQSLGYRNFSSFLNSYRIEAVKRMMQDPEKLRIPILSLALECGFASLAPFNRAFKNTEGITPTEFRERFETQANRG